MSCATLVTTVLEGNAIVIGLVDSRDAVIPSRCKTARTLHIDFLKGNFFLTKHLVAESLKTPGTVA